MTVLWFTCANETYTLNIYIHDCTHFNLLKTYLSGENILILLESKFKITTEMSSSVWQIPLLLV